jgi:CBS domain-containing protein
MDLARNLKMDCVSRLNPTPPWSVAPTQTVDEAVQLMRDKRVGCVLVCVDRRVVGIFTERDLIRRVMAEARPMTLTVAECMTPDPVTVHPKDPISCAVKRMQQGGYRHLPVVGTDGRPVGILSVKRIVHYLVEHFPGSVYNHRPNCAATHPKREGA